MQAKIVFLDLETAPSLGWTWGPKWETSIIDFKKDWYLLSFSYKWADEKKTYVKCLADYPEFKKNMENDKVLVKDLWNIFDSADIVVAHNASSFDVKKANTRFITHGLHPPSPYKVVDTLRIARKVFKFDSNKLDDLGRYLGLGRKLPNMGFHLWKNCMLGDTKAWKQMGAYNKQDVVLLEKVYYLLRSWSTHPNVNKGDRDACPKCGSKDVQKRGFSHTLYTTKQRYQCQGCYGWHESSAKKVV